MSNKLKICQTVERAISGTILQKAASSTIKTSLSNVLTSINKAQPHSITHTNDNYSTLAKKKLPKVTT